MLSTDLVSKKEKVLVCITIQHNSKRLIKKGYEIAHKIGGELHILHIAKGESIFADSKSGPLLEDLFKYASDLGAEVHFECSDDITKYIATFIKDKSITCIVLGETLRNALQQFITKNIKSSLESSFPDIKIVVLERDTPIVPTTNKIFSV